MAAHETMAASSASTARQRLMTERKNFRTSHPVNFVAYPMKKPDGSVDLFRWKCGVPGKEGTDWAGVTYWLEMNFPEDYPSKPPVCRFTPPLYHINVFPEGWICLSILNAEKDYAPSISVTQLLLGIQGLVRELDTPNPLSVANFGPYEVHKASVEQYNRNVRAFVKDYARKYGDQGEKE